MLYSETSDNISLDVKCLSGTPMLDDYNSLTLSSSVKLNLFSLSTYYLKINKAIIYSFLLFH